MAVTDGRDGFHHGKTINMARHHMTTKFITEAQGPFQIDDITLTPLTKRCHIDGFCRCCDLKAVRIA